MDRNNVALTNGGGTLVLGTHDIVIGPGGQDVYTDNDGPIIVYRNYSVLCVEGTCTERKPVTRLLHFCRASGKLSLSWQCISNGALTG